MLLELHDTYGKSANSETQMYYEFGIFSTIYKGTEIAKCIRRICKGPSISFTIPLSRNKLRGLNFCYMETVPPKMPYIRVRNVTSNRTWIYEPYIDFVNGEHCFSCLSHWMFGENEMKGGDKITISVEKGHYSHGQHTKECGVGLVYEDEKDNFEEEEDALDYYKSWNYIIGRDLTPFQLTTGEFVLNNDGFLAYASRTNDCYHLFFDYGACYKEEGRVAFKEAFKAFSKKESRILGSEDKKPQLETPCDKMWKQSHYKNESMPLVLECSSSVVESVELEENIQEHNLDWVDRRPSKTWEAYEEYIMKKYGDDANEHPQFDHDFWPRASNKGNKGLYNLSNVSELLALITTTPSTTYSNTQYEPTRPDLEIQRLNGVIEELAKEKEAMHNRMTNMEALLKLMF